MTHSPTTPANLAQEPEFETAPDNGTPAEVLAYVLDCARRWVPEARIIGNARAGDIERAIAAIGAGGRAVQDTWFTDRALPVMAISGDVEDSRVLRLHFRRPVTDDDRKAMCDALNLHQASLSQPHPADERMVEALPRPDAVSMASGTICLEYVDRDERDLAFDWLEAHGAGATLAASHMPVGDGQKYRLLEAGEIIASDDEFIGDDGITWERVKGWPVGYTYTHIFKSCRRPLAAARAGEDGL